MKYHQCDLANGNARTRAYIAERGAIIGARVELREGGYDDGLWTVTSVGYPGLDEALLSEQQRKSRNAFGSIDGERKAIG